MEIPGQAKSTNPENPGQESEPRIEQQLAFLVQADKQRMSFAAPC